MRYSNTSNTLEYCNSTAWTSLGPSATSPVSFRAYRSTNQTVSINTFVKLDFDAEVYDTNANFDPSTDRFQPTVAGKYLVTAAVDCTNATGGLCFSNIYKNGLRIAVAGNSVATAGDNVHNVTTVVDMNGPSDYLEAFVYSGGNTVEISADMAFTGTLLGPQTGGSGGGATPAGTDTQVQFNDGGSALGGDADYTWNKTTNKLTITGDIDYTGLLTDTSDRRQKTNIEEFPAALERLMVLKPVTFRMKQGRKDIEYGFIAQDVRPLFPELVRGDETLSLNYIGLMAPMVKAIQELKTWLRPRTASCARPCTTSPPR